jgi:hypothetical protein
LLTLRLITENEKVPSTYNCIGLWPFSLGTAAI